MVGRSGALRREAHMRRLGLMAIIAGVLAAAGPATAGGRPDRPASGGETISFAVPTVVFAAPSGFCAVATATFPLESPAGDAVGRGRACIRTLAGCDPFFVGCHQRADAVFRLRFTGRGLLRIRVQIREVFVSENRVVQWVRGFVVRGTGDFRGARGTIAGGGTAAFTATGVDADLHYVIRLR
jgi:hypothetical protein